MSVIYLISTIRKNGKGVFYIGSSINDDQRWKEHLCSFRKGRHGNPYLQNLYNTGHDLNFEILEHLGDVGIKKTQEREQEWIDSFNAISSKDFTNVREACGGCSDTAKPVVLVSPFGYLIHKPSVKKAEEFLGVSRGAVSRVCRNKGHHTKGYQCFFKEDYAPEKVLKDPLNMKTKANKINGLKRLVGFVGYRGGEEFDIENMAHFCEEEGMKRSTAQNLYGPLKSKHRSGLQLRRKDDVPYNWK